jgi:hypothetical protein
MMPANGRASKLRGGMLPSFLQEHAAAQHHA